MKLERSTCWSPSEEQRPCYQLEGPTSPRIVTGKQHSKAYVDEPHCTVNTFIHINIPIT
jgi:hypothetical protein